MLLGHGSEFSMVPSRAQPSPVPQPSCPSLCSSRAAFLPPRSGTTRATRPPRLCVSFCFGGASTMHPPHGVQRSPGVRLHSAAPRVYLPMNLSPAEANPVRGSSRVARPARGLRRGREGGREGLGRARDLVLAGTRSRTFSFRGQQFRIGAYAK